MARPTLAQQLAEIEALEELKPRVRRFTVFGDDNRAAIEAQIEVIGKHMTDDQVYDREGSGEWNEFIVGNADDALNWLAGDESEPLSKGWAELAQ